MHGMLMEPVEKYNFLTNKYYEHEIQNGARHLQIAFRPIINEDEATKILVECLHFTVKLLFINNALT